MPIRQSLLYEKSQRTVVAKAQSLNQAKALSLKTAFLCHSHKDANLVKGLVNFLAEKGISLYVDWADTSMPDKPNRETAEKIQKKIIETDYFLFLATNNSMTSRWCPWEIGYADGKKEIGHILILPTSDSSNNTYGNEYLELYRKIDIAQGGDFGVWLPNGTNSWYLKHYL